MRLKLQKRSEWKFVSRIIPHKQVFNTPQLALGFIPVITINQELITTVPFFPEYISTLILDKPSAIRKKQSL